MKLRCFLRSGLRYSEAARRSLEVVTVLGGAARLESLRKALPPEFVELFEGASKGPLTASPERCEPFESNKPASRQSLQTALPAGRSADPLNRE